MILIFDDALAQRSQHWFVAGGCWFDPRTWQMFLHIQILAVVWAFDLVYCVCFQTPNTGDNPGEGICEALFIYVSLMFYIADDTAARCLAVSISHYLQNSLQHTLESAIRK